MPYHGRSTGRIQDFLSEMTGGQNAFSCTIITCPKDDKPGLISLYGKPFVEYTWKEDTDIPMFEFVGKHAHFKSEPLVSHAECIKRFGWWRIDPDDRYEGTTGVYAACHHGTSMNIFEKAEVLKTCEEQRAKWPTNLRNKETQSEVITGTNNTG